MGRRFSDNAAMVVMEWVIKSEKSNVKSQDTKVKELPSGKKEEKKNSPAGEKKETKEKTGKAKK
jgi:hypothetical protein